MPRTGSPRRALVLYALFFLSGASSLVFENLWQRKMMHVFGASAPSITVILTAFFCGMAFGSWWGGRLLARLQHRIPTLRFYALTEVWIGATGVAVPALLAGVDRLYLAVFGPGEPDPLLSVSYRFVLCVAVALPASLGMGATIPVMSRLLAEQGRRVGRSVAAAYGVNTLGAVLGCLATGFVLLPALGIQGSLFFASLLNGVVVVGSLLLSARARATPPEPASPQPTPGGASPGQRRVLLALYAIAGFVAIGFEVTWMRMIAIFTTNGLTTFTLGLAIYLTGFSLGSLALYPLLERRLRGLDVFLVSNLGIAASCLLILPHAQEISNGIWAVMEARVQGRASNLVWITSVELLNAAALMLLPTVFMGLAFPAVCQALTESRDRIALESGFLYFVGNLGSTLGAFATGLFLIPTLSLDGSVGLLMALCCGLAAATLALAGGSWRRAGQLACVGLAGLALYAGTADRPYLHNDRVEREGDHWRFVTPEGAPRPMTIIRNETGPSATVSVREWTNTSTGRVDRMIYIDDQVVAATQRFSKVDSKMLAHLPLLLHPEPQRALTVGFGSGGTSWSMTTHGVRTDVVEIEPEVVRAAPLFEMQNHGVLRSPLLRVILNDARNHLYVTRERYDVISTDVTNLQYKQNGSLYTREFFELVRDRLTPQGIACAWIPLIVEDHEFSTLLATFRSVFPHATLWFFDQTPTTFAILIGTPEPLRLDYARLERGFEREAVREDLARVGIFHPLHFVHFLYLDEGGYRNFAAGAALHTDDHPILEFRSHVSYWVRESSMEQRFARLWQLRPRDLAPRISNLDSSQLPLLHRYARFARAWGAFVNYENLDPDKVRGKPEFYRRGLPLLEQAVEAVPEYGPAARRLREFRARLGLEEPPPA